MKTKNLFLTSAALLAAAPVLSWAQSTVTISGIIDGGVRVDSGTTTGTIKSVGSGQATTSRLDFIGVEDLGDGLKASFVLESGLAIDTGTGISNPPGAAAGSFTWGRTAAVALGSDSMGYVSLGRQYTPLWALSAGGANDPFGATWLGGINTVYSTTVRASNSVVYSYGYGPKTMLLPAPRQGLGVAVMYSAAEVADNSGQQLGLNVSYGDGPWWAGYGIHEVKGSNTSISATAPVTNTPTLRQQTLGAAYVFGSARLNLGLNQGTNGLTGAGAFNRRSWDIGGTLAIGLQHTVRFLYGRADDRTTANADFSTWQLGYQYDLSKRTMLYAAAGVLDNSANAAATLAGVAGAYAKGSTGRSVITGMRHTF